MPPVAELRARRQHAQHLAKPRLAPADVVAAFGAMQGQEYAMAKWAIGLRSPGTTDDDIERAIAAGQILRTHSMRHTHHFVSPRDIRWLLALLGPIAIKKGARRWHELDLDDKTVGKANDLLARALEGGKHLVRAEVAALWQKHRISVEGQRLPHLILRAELAGLVCSGARRGKQITVALVDERAPRTTPLERDEALAELATRYFTTRGPATPQDFTWWSGLSAADTKRAIELAKVPPARPGRAPTRAYLIPTYDEYTVAYRDRRAIGTPPHDARGFGESTLLGPGIVVGGEVVGSWSRTIVRNSVRVELRTWRKLSARASATVTQAAKRYAAFLGLPLE